VHVHRIFNAEAISGPRAEPVGVGIADHRTVLLRREVGQTLGEHIGASLAHFLQCRRLQLKTPGSVRHPMGVNGLDGNEIGIGGISQQHGGQQEQRQSNSICTATQADLPGDCKVGHSRATDEKDPEALVLKILLLSNDPTTLALMRACTDALKGTLDAFSDATDLTRKLGKPTNDVPLVVALDLPLLAAARGRVANACGRVRQMHPTARVGLIASATHLIEEKSEAWAIEAGADVIVPQINAWRWAATGERLLSALVSDADAVQTATRRVTPYLRAAAQTGGNNILARVIAGAEAQGIDLPALAFRMQRSGGVNIADRSYRLRIYPECFVASEGVTWLERALRVPRDNAIAIGQALQAAGLIYHVTREQTFSDENLYFRVAQIPQRWNIESFYSLIRSPAGFSVLDRSYLGNSYSKCFVGSEAVTWMQDQGYTVNEALSIGQRLIDLSLAHHVVDEHPFKNEKLFYRFYRDESPSADS